MEIKKMYKKISKNKVLTWTTIVIAVALVLIALYFSYYLAFTYPENQVSQLGITNVTDKANFINQYRTTSIQFIATLAQIFGGIAVAIGIYFAWGNLLTSQENLKVLQEGQITERFTRAVDQLGSDKLQIRLGGIYALESIANESDKDYWPIMEILMAYVRENSKYVYSEEEITSIKKQMVESKHIQEILEDYFSTQIKPDIAAILEIIKKRKYSITSNILIERDSINLQRTYLNGVDLGGTHLEYAVFRGTSLSKATLPWANLTNAFLFGAILIFSDFSHATLRTAYLNGADLEGANLSNANLEGAILEKANLTDTNLEGANLKGAKNLTVEQLSKVFSLYRAQLDPEHEAELRAKGFGNLIDDEPK